MMSHDLTGGLTGEHLKGFHSGADTELWRRLGSHAATVEDDERGRLQGTRFAVWAPNAKAVSVIGDFNGWNTDANPMRFVDGAGVWGGFVSDIGPGTVYKYRIHCYDGVWRDKADPMATFAEGPPATGSIVHESSYEWSDDAWLDKRGKAKAHAEPMSIYELHLPSWRPGLTYVELAQDLVDYVTWQGYTHVEFMPLSQHPFSGSWGYQVTGYYASYSPLGTPDELRYLIDRLHQAGIGVFMDWVPGHFPKDEFALGRFDGTSLYEHSDPRQGEQLDWGTYVFNFGRNEVKSFLVSNALYWVQDFHIDGLRVDAVASMLYLDYSRPADGWVPNAHGGNENLEAIDFLKYVNKHLYERVPGVITAAEESTSFPGVTREVHNGGLGFGFKWNMGWMNDSLGYLEREPIYRQYHHHEMTFAMVYAFTENFILPISHDEVVHGKGSMVNKAPGDDWQKFASLRAFYAFMWSFPGKKLIFQGCEFGQRSEFSELKGPEWWVSDLWGHNGLQKLFRDMNLTYRAHSALWELDSEPEGFRWIRADDSGANTFSFLRSDAKGNHLASVVNFSASPLTNYRIGLPAAGSWREVLNTDSESYDGTGQTGNLGSATAIEGDYEGFAASAEVSVPPMGAVWLAFGPGSEDGHDVLDGVIEADAELA